MRGAGGSRSRPVLAWAAAAGMAAVLVWHALPAARSRSLFDAARAAADAGEIDVAAGLARAAASARPRDPDPHAFLAQLVFADLMHDGAARDEGERAAERAVALEPDAAVLHYTLGLYRHAAGETAAAWLERTRARALFPMKPLYSGPPAAPEPGRP